MFVKDFRRFKHETFKKYILKNRHLFKRINKNALFRKIMN